MGNECLPCSFITNTLFIASINWVHILTAFLGNSKSSTSYSRQTANLEYFIDAVHNCAFISDAVPDNFLINTLIYCDLLFRLFMLPLQMMSSLMYIGSQQMMSFWRYLVHRSGQHENTSFTDQSLLSSDSTFTI